MGYLNYNLEKIASAVEGEMEKQALKIGDLVRMGKSAVNSGRSVHFAKRLMQRNRALANPANISKRTNQFFDAEKKLGDAAYLEKGYGTIGPARRELARLEGRMIPNHSTVIDSLTLASPDKYGLRSLNNMLSTKNVPVSPVELSNVANQLSRNYGAVV
jgi:hypothetical protein